MKKNLRSVQGRLEKSVCSFPLSPTTQLQCPGNVRRTPKELIESGGKLVDGVAAEAVHRAALGSFLAWETDAVAAANNIGYTGNNQFDAVKCLMEKVEKSGEVSIVPRGPVYVHESGSPGLPFLCARIKKPTRVLDSAAVWKKLVEKGDNKKHWLNSRVEYRGKRVPVWKAYPVLIVGEEVWETHTDGFPRPSHEKYGRSGSPGTPFWILVLGTSG